MHGHMNLKFVQLLYLISIFCVIRMFINEFR